MIDPLAGVDGFLQAFGAALAGYDVDGAVARFSLPCLLMTDEYTVPVRAPDELRAALSMSIEVFGQVGVTRASATVLGVDALGVTAASARVRWTYLDDDGPLAGAEHFYLLRAGDDGLRAHVDLAVDGEREIRALAHRLGVT